MSELELQQMKEYAYLMKEIYEENGGNPLKIGWTKIATSDEFGFSQDRKI